METLLRPFVGWVIGLTPDNQTRKKKLKITLLFTLLSSFIGSILVYHFIMRWKGEVVALLDTAKLAPEGSSPALYDMLIQTLVYDSLIYLFVGLSFVLAGGYAISTLLVRSQQRASEAQKRFIQDASHELRTPLSVQRLNMELALLEMEQDGVDQNRCKAVLTDSLEEIDRMARIIENLIVISESTGRGQLYFQRADMSKIILDAVGQVEHFAHKRKITVMVPHNDPIRLWANRIALTEMLVNLLNNSLNYTPRGGAIEVSTRTMGGGALAEIRVSDTGTGVHKDDLPNIFNPFYRGRTDVAHKKLKGHGLGLTIAKHIVGEHKGTIQAQNNPDRGLSIFVTIPIFTKGKNYLEDDVEETS